MRRKQFTEEQTTGILKEAEAGTMVTELCRKRGMSSATHRAWRAKCNDPLAERLRAFTTFSAHERASDHE